MTGNWPNLVNGAFELAGACALAMNVRQLLRDQELKGVHWGPTVFFTAWGLWNLLYYPHLGQWASFCGGLAIVAVNLVWLWLIAWFGGLQYRWYRLKRRWLDRRRPAGPPPPMHINCRCRYVRTLEYGDEPQD